MGSPRKVPGCPHQQATLERVQRFPGKGHFYNMVSWGVVDSDERDNPIPLIKMESYILALQLSSCVSLSKLLKVSVPPMSSSIKQGLKIVAAS